MASLVITGGHQAGSYYTLRNRTLTAGRDPARDIQIVDHKVSRKHFQIHKEDQGYVILELRSKNGVYVNGTKVKEKLLRDSDQIQVGDTVLTFYEGEVPEHTDALNKYKQASRETREEQTFLD